jgi:hypothetical protein
MVLRSYLAAPQPTASTEASGRRCNSSAVTWRTAVAGTHGALAAPQRERNTTCFRSPR